MNKNKKTKILIIKLRKGDDVLSPQVIVGLLNEIYESIQVDLVIDSESEHDMLLPLINKIHIYTKYSKDLSFFKRLFNEIKFLFLLKKEKYKAAILTIPSDKSVIIAKYAKIKQIVGFKSKGNKINKIITHEIPLNKNIKIDDIKAILSSLEFD